jgi:CDP-diacylglycerol--glycerol-3-phosphate 3-phosphatidyltransferase
MLQGSLRPPMTRLITPLSRGLLKIGVSANSITVFGAIGTVSASLTLFTTGHLFAGTMVITAFVLTDLLDGTLARMSPQGSSTWGALLDSTLDRLGDAAVLGSLMYRLNASHDRLVGVAFVALIAGTLISYIKARAESLDIQCNGGIAERTERLIILLVATGFAGLGVHYILALGIWLLTILSVITVVQRLTIVYRATTER